MTAKTAAPTESKDPVLLVLAGPAGSGKSTLCDRLVAAGMGFSRIVTSTTRAPRSGESNGVHYHFFKPAEFDAKVAAGEFLEWAWVHGDRRYGTLAASVLGPLLLGKNLVMSVDVQGVESLRRIAGTNPLLRGAMATDFYSLKGGKQTLEPIFTFHGFRFRVLRRERNRITALRIVAVPRESEAAEKKPRRAGKAF